MKAKSSDFPSVVLVLMVVAFAAAWVSTCGTPTELYSDVAMAHAPERAGEGGAR